MSNQEKKLFDSYDEKEVVITENGKYGIKTPDGEVILPPLYDNFKKPMYLKKGTRVVVEVRGKWGVVIADGTGTWLIKPEYEYIGYPNDIVNICKNGLWGVLNIATGEYLIPPECESVSNDQGFIFTNGIGYYEKGGKCGVIRDDGAFTEAIYDEVDGFPDEVVKVKYNGQWGYIDENNSFTTDEDSACYHFDVE